MLKQTIVISALFILTFGQHIQAQVVCIFCYDQQAPVSTGVNDLISNGSFENHNCSAPGYICPSSTNYACDLTDWTATGGGTSTYAQAFNAWISEIPDGNWAVYMGNFFCQPCSQTPDDYSCLTFDGSDCEMDPLPAGYPQNTPDYGGTDGFSIEQNVTGLTVGELYVLEFWVGGEQMVGDPGFFGIDLGFGYHILQCEETPINSGATGTRYVIEFNATATSHVIKFTNWGHPCNTCSEPVFDDVKMYAFNDPQAQAPDCGGSGGGTGNPLPTPTPVAGTLFIPNVFTPNGDTDNDEFTINYTGTESYELVILNRWGNIMFESTDKNIHWDGFVESREASEGTYFYKLNVGSEEYHGHLTLIR